MSNDVSFRQDPSELEERVLGVMPVGQDVSIAEMHNAACPNSKHIGYTSRQMQQRLGQTIKRLNAKMTNARIEPIGQRQTYRLTLTG